MRIHRFYTGSEVELKHDFWVHDTRLVNQWRKVLRMTPGQELVLFDGVTHDRLYKLLEINEREAHLEHVTDFERKLPKRELYLLWALLKKDKNDWVLQKCTELGVSHFLPLLADRCERTDLSQNRLERWKKIVIEAAEQCGRSDIPNVRDPMHVKTALEELSGRIQIGAAEQEGLEFGAWNLDFGRPVGILVGPEGGWSDAEKQLFNDNNLNHLNLHDFTLRAETAAVTAVSKLLQ